MPRRALFGGDLGTSSAGGVGSSRIRRPAFECLDAKQPEMVRSHPAIAQIAHDEQHLWLFARQEILLQIRTVRGAEIIRTVLRCLASRASTKSFRFFDF